MTFYEIATIVISFVSVIVATTGIYLIYRQLQAMVASIQIAIDDNKNSNLMTVLALEESVSKCRVAMSEAAVKAALIADDEKRKNITEASIALTLAKLQYDEKTEQYINALDRLCSCIVRGYIDEEQYRQDYRNGIAETIKNHKEFFGADTRHHNILAVHTAWSQDKLACEKPKKLLMK